LTVYPFSNTVKNLDDRSRVRAIAIIVLTAGCGADPAPTTAPILIADDDPLDPPDPPLALAPTGDGTAIERTGAFATGAAPLTFSASARRGTQLVVWAQLYRHHAIDPRFCPHVVHRFAPHETVAITLGFDWQPRPGNFVHRYTLAVDGDQATASIQNPQYPVYIEAGGDPHADPTAVDTDYTLLFWFADPHMATGVGWDADAGIPLHQLGIVIRARFVAPQERPVELDATTCAPRPAP
jgi:hypothetical protein